METVTTENKFYSRRLTNEMRQTMLYKVKEHIDKEFVTNPLFLEAKELIERFAEAFLTEFYKEMPAEDYATIMKYKNFTVGVKFNINKEVNNGKTSYTSNYLWKTIPFGPNLTDEFRIPDLGHNTIKWLANQTYNALGNEFCEKFYETLYLNQCEKEKVLLAVKTILNSATTTGKLVEAYPDMMKFISEEWKKKVTTKSAPTTVRNVDVDVNAFLK